MMSFNRTRGSIPRQLCLGLLALALALGAGCGGGGEKEKAATPKETSDSPPKKPVAGFPSPTPAPVAGTPAETPPTGIPPTTPTAPEATEAPTEPKSETQPAAVAGELSGTGKFDGEPPSRTVVKMSADAKCEAMHGGKKVGSEEVIVGKNGELANVFVYVKKGLEGREFPAPATAAELDQKGCMYEPHVLAMMVGQQLDVVSSDNTLHNVHCLGKENPEFNFGMPAPGKRDRVFRKTEIGIKFKCDVHPWMGAWLHVVPHPYFAVSDRAGAWTIRGLPPGEYTLAAWHEKYGEQERKITVTEAGLAGVEFTFKAAEKK